MLVGNEFRPKTVHGFTLLELLLVIAIISVFAGISFPFIKKSIKSTEFRSFSNKTYLFLDYAKTQSVLRNAVLKVKFDLDNKQVSLVERIEELPETVLQKINIPKNINIELENEEIPFYPDATLQPFEIRIFDNENRGAVVSSKGVDGKIILK
ncbi:MAG: prepilin-type N-terminal cleavage/methylation domain-containing protein [Candidatus Omnitrophota bacterium]|nr:MAG: prepilin-type N-terminal cleavage/methylation domain-containing protein [Candidatus Omnitrophota bacterium]